MKNAEGAKTQRSQSVSFVMLERCHTTKGGAVDGADGKLARACSTGGFTCAYLI